MTSWHSQWDCIPPSVASRQSLQIMTSSRLLVPENEKCKSREITYLIKKYKLSVDGNNTNYFTVKLVALKASVLRENAIYCD